MPEVIGYTTQIKISGAPTFMTTEAATQDATQKKYQITTESKRVLEREGTIRVHLKGANDAAEASTTTTTIKMAAHGLAVNDLICNTTCSNAFRLVLTVPDAGTITVAAVTGQASGDVIETYKTQPESLYNLNRLNGTVTFPTATSRVIRISGNYLPMSVAAYANQMSKNEAADILDVTKFGDTYHKRKAGLKSASGSLTNFYSVDEVFSAALTAGEPVVIEDRTAAAAEPDRYWALLESSEVSAAIEGMQSQAVSWISHDAWIKLGE